MDMAEGPRIWYTMPRITRPNGPPLRESRMSSHICLRVHFIWSTAKRDPLIDPKWEHRLFAYIGTVLADRRGVLLAANGTTDHIHLYASLPATLSLAETVNALKANSSRWIHDTLAVLAFAW